MSPTSTTVIPGPGHVVTGTGTEVAPQHSAVAKIAPGAGSTQSRHATKVPSARVIAIASVYGAPDTGSPRTTSTTQHGTGVPVASRTRPWTSNWSDRHWARTGDGASANTAATAVATSARTDLITTPPARRGCRPGT